jgi:hypothetical protein
MTDDNWRPGPQYCADSFQMAFCDEPNCGLHMIGYDKDHKPMCEIIMNPKQTLAMMNLCKGALYEKAVKKS